MVLVLLLRFFFILYFLEGLKSRSGTVVLLFLFPGYQKITYTIFLEKNILLFFFFLEPLIEMVSKKSGKTGAGKSQSES